MTYSEVVKEVSRIFNGSSNVIDYYWSLNDSMYYNNYGEHKWDVIKELNHLCRVINERTLRLKTEDSDGVNPNC